MDKNQHSWLSLMIFFIYRCGLALLFCLVFFLGLGPSLLGSHAPALYQGLSLTYLVLTLSTVVACNFGHKSLTVQTVAAVLTDIVFLTLLMHSSGGLRSGIGILIAVSIAAGGLLSKSRASLFFASVASLSILTEQIYAHWMSSFETTSYSLAGMLGAVFFATAILAHHLGSRLEQSEAVARERGQQVEQLQALNQLIVQNLQSGIIICKSTGDILNMNMAAREAFSLSHPAESLSALPEIVFHHYSNWKNHPEAESFIVIPENNDDEIQLRFSQIGPPNRGYTLIFLESSRITNQRVQQRKLAEIGTLSASIAHEIRNPLGAISHAQQLLQETTTLTPEDHNLLAIIDKNTKRLNQTIENVLQLSRNATPHRNTLVLSPWLNHFCEEFRLLNLVDNPNIHVDCPDEFASLECRVDPSHLEQILAGLCNNALKHAGQQPSIRLRISKTKSYPVIQVIDNGPGVNPAIQSRLFEPFFSTSEKGNGLGLYVARGLAELNHGSLSYSRSENNESCFVLQLAPNHSPTISL